MGESLLQRLCRCRAVGRSTERRRLRPEQQYRRGISLGKCQCRLRRSGNADRQRCGLRRRDPAHAGSCEHRGGASTLCLSGLASVAVLSQLLFRRRRRRRRSTYRRLSVVRERSRRADGERREPRRGAREFHSRRGEALTSPVYARVRRDLQRPGLAKPFEPVTGFYGYRTRTAQIATFIDSAGHAIRTEIWQSSGVPGIDDTALAEAQGSTYEPAQFLCTPVVSIAIFSITYEVR